MPLCGLARRRLGDWTVRDAQGELRVAVPAQRSPDYLRLGTAQIRLVLDDARRATAQPADVEAVAAEAAAALRLLGGDPSPAAAA